MERSFVEDATTIEGLRPAAAEEPVVATEWHAIPRRWGLQEGRRAAAEAAAQRPRPTSGQGRVKPWINKVRRNVKKSHPRFHPTNRPTIFRVPANISEIDRAAYEPSIISIGPLHGRHEELQNCKWKFMRCLLSRYRNGNDVFQECLTELKARDAEVRGCYSVNLRYIDPSKLATTMLLDGCFIIYLMLRWQEEGDTHSIVTSPHRLETLEGSVEDGTSNLTGESIWEQEDEEGMVTGVPKLYSVTTVSGSESESESVVDLEIGVSLLGTLQRSAEQGTPNLTGETIAEMVDEVQESGMEEQEEEEGVFTCMPELDLESVLGSGSESESVVDLEMDGEENFDGSLLGHLWIWNLIVYDLLKLGNQIPFFVIRLIFDKLFEPPSNGAGNDDQLTDLALNLFSDIHPNKSRRFRTMPPNKIHHLLHLFHSSIVTDWQASQPSVVAALRRASRSPQWIPNATDLVAKAGVEFKSKEEFDSFLDISFKNGILEIPPLQIFDHSKSLFQNLIAFEQCYPDTNADITTYANFMNCIIDTADDTRLLHKKGILFKRPRTDDDKGASPFSQLCNQIHFDPRKNYLNNLFVQVTKYRESKFYRFRAIMFRNWGKLIFSVVLSVLAFWLQRYLSISKVKL